MKCTFCGSNKHTEKNCPQTHEGWINRLHMYCTYCGSQRHDIKACPRLIGIAVQNEELFDHYIKD
jgi:hypothetical protein